MLADKLIGVLQNRKLCSNSEWVLPSVKDNSKHISHSTIHQAWAKIRKKAGIQNEQYMILEERLQFG
ncbi:integrase [Orientia tsutsugamushi]|nr:integrase [Orientia tsutsugamushi]